MSAPDWKHWDLDDGIVRESTPEPNRIILWRPGARDGSYQYWDRIGNVARAEVTVQEGLCATSATFIRARQKTRGLFSKLLPKFGGAEGRSWTLPNGEIAEQCGDRRTDLMLVWAEDESQPIDESRIKAQWPQSQGLERIGKNLFLVLGVEQKIAKPAPPEPPPQACPRAQAEELLAAARRSGDKSREATALADLGIVYRSEGDPQRASMYLEQALALVRQLGDRSKEVDILGNLGLAMLGIGQFAGKALEMFQQELNMAREAGNRFAEKTALDHLGLAYASLRDPGRALPFFDQALAIAQQVGDAQHMANLLWQQAIQFAELGQRDQAIARGQATVDLLRHQGKPQADWFADHLRKFQMGEAGVWLGGSTFDGSPEAYLGGSVVASVMAGASPATGQATGPGLLRMAFSATKAMAKFLGSGMKTSPPDVARKRIETCNACEHHTGLRCRICGCFTNVKTKMLYEQCPVGKWPA
jgi:tetratricopeptide (TPR) repeat protein